MAVLRKENAKLLHKVGFLEKQAQARNDSDESTVNGLKQQIETERKEFNSKMRELEAKLKKFAKEKNELEFQLKCAEWRT